MSNQPPLIDHSIIKSLYPLSLIADHLIDRLIEHVEIEFPSFGSTIIKGTDSGYSHYLIEGSIERRVSFDNRSSINCSDARCVNPLEELLAEGGVIKANDQCSIMRVACDAVDKFISWSQSQEFKVVHMDEGEVDLNGDAKIDDDYQDDWTEVFLQSDLAANIPAATMMQLFAKLEDVEVEPGQSIIQENTPGDYFYIIKKGMAQVFTNAQGPFAGEVFELSTGDYFGDEALVAETIRNARVVMAKGGLLGRLDSESFDEIIKTPLMHAFSEDDINAFDQDKISLLDVRLAAEYRHGHLEKAKNYPIAYIRKHLDSFDKDFHYVITTECRRRSELAVYLMRQAGYDVYLYER